VPPLRKRTEDVIQLAQHFLEHTCNDFGRKPLKLTRGQAASLLAYEWPGNVRELKNVVERAVILSKGNTLRLDLSLPESSGAAATGSPGSAENIYTDKQMRSLQKQNFIAALNQSNWKVSGNGGAAELLGIKPTTLTDRIKSFGIRKPGN
jgi:transcriptional regulator with GAF, ATPase, and Fis domain